MDTPAGSAGQQTETFTMYPHGKPGKPGKSGSIKAVFQKDKRDNWNRKSGSTGLLFLYSKSIISYQCYNPQRQQRSGEN